MVSFERLAITGCLLLCLGGCGSVALQPSGTAGADGGASGAAGGITGAAGAGGSLGTVTLRLDLPSSLSFCDVSCGGVAPHITILTVDKKPVPTQIPSCIPMCAVNCQTFGCPQGGACLLTGAAVTGAELEWDGSTYPTSTCGGGATCYQPTFAASGTYIARMCATPGTLSKPGDSPPLCNATGVQSCVDVMFAYPAGGVVEATLAGVAPTCGSIRASDYDQSCKANSDCVVVPEGDFCQGNQCACPNAPLSAHAQMLYLSDLAGRSPTPSVCACPNVRVPACVEGKCVL